jgi:hypothetical protein
MIMKRQVNHSRKVLPPIFGMLGIFVTIMTLGTLIKILEFVPEFLEDAKLGLTMGVIASFALVTITWILDRNPTLNSRLNLGKISLKWLVISFVVCITMFLGILIFFSRTDMILSDLIFDIDAPYVADFAFFSIVTIILTLAGEMGYFGMKNLLQRKSIVKIKLAIYSLVSISMIMALPIGLFYVDVYLNDYSVVENYNWNDGPWLTWDDDPSTSIVISWTTAVDKNTKLYYGTDPDVLQPYTDASFKHLHHANLTELTPDTLYYYRINEAFTTQHEDNLFSFRTSPSSDAPFKFAIVGDMQPTDALTMRGGELVAKGIAQQDPNFVLQLGDLASSGGNIMYYHNVLTNLPYFASQSPIQSAIGNHDHGGDNGLNFHNLFQYNYVADGLGEIGEHYYSFDYLNAHFIMIDSPSLTTTQKNWVEDDIDAAQAMGQEWIFISLHYTVMTTGTSSDNWDIQQWLVPLADREGIDAVFFGHDHHYEHWNYTYGATNLLYSDTDVPSGKPVQYFCTGAGGSNLEIDYGILEMGTRTYTRNFYNSSSTSYQDVIFEYTQWNSNRYIDHTANPEYGQLYDGKHYYHAPEIESFTNSTETYGYMYGEQTLHYLLVEIDGNDCTISARYPNGDLLQGPENAYPQQWTFTKI